MSWQAILTQLELDVAAYQRLVADPEANAPPAWAPTTTAGPPPPELHDRLVAALQRLRDVERTLEAVRDATAGDLAALARPAQPAAPARYLDTTV